MPHAVDRLLAALGLLVLSPLILAAAIWIKVDSRGPVLYRQRRVGKDGREFEMLKLRTMRQGSDPVGVGTVVGEGDPRVTRPGELMRRTSFDEVPNLVNVLRGEMAIVGPRPALPAHLDYFDLRGHPRFSVLPGITGWAQVQGRTEITWPERVELDDWYVQHRTPMLDLRILWMTILPVLKGEGVSPE
ncbi:MAG TPA: sugar transferase [Solirubrobacterales bacterium]|jgi:lipopolysaccharide/colanic/teichoic acid biosynthesis glycosyltransferase|nr:sugar transferase [Solirubrobacterales bacterium]